MATQCKWPPTDSIIGGKLPLAIGIRDQALSSFGNSAGSGFWHARVQEWFAYFHFGVMVCENFGGASAAIRAACPHVQTDCKP